ncbi:hypothetical protein SMRU11_29105 [Sinorhizobium meliloti RU11/001]|nr:hypothetical protein SMRU11_29105 [Sinorhizobium meliloti RU11/001]
MLSSGRKSVEAKPTISSSRAGAFRVDQLVERQRICGSGFLSDKQGPDRTAANSASTYLREHFDPRWPWVREWLDEITPADNRFINPIRTVCDTQAIVFGDRFRRIWRT